MCGRFTHRWIWQELHQKLIAILGPVDAAALDAAPGQPQRYNIAPTQPVIALWKEQGRIKAGFMRWGLVPVWVKDPRDFPLIINARAETLFEKPAFKGGLRHHRCIVPASGYYEWAKMSDRAKQPNYLTLAGDEPLYFAGLYSNWLGPSGEEIDTLAIITVPAGKGLEHLHPRMPAILAPKQLPDWLDVDGVHEKTAAQMLAPTPAEKMKVYPVSTRVNSVRNDDASLLAPATEDAPPKPGKAQLDLF